MRASDSKSYSSFFENPQTTREDKRRNHLIEHIKILKELSKTLRKYRKPVTQTEQLVLDLLMNLSYLLESNQLEKLNDTVRNVLFDEHKITRHYLHHNENIRHLIRSIVGDNEYQAISFSIDSRSYR